MSTDFIPRNDNTFMVWLKTLVAYMLTKFTEWNIPQAEVTELNALTQAFGNALEVSDNPATRTKVSIQVKNDARKAVESKTRILLKAYVTYNPAVSDADRDSMGLPVHKTTRTPSHVEETAPDSDTNTSVAGRVTINFFAKGSNHKKGKPAGQHGAEIAWLVSDTPPSKWSDLTHSAIDTNSPFTLEFENDQRGKTVYFALRWENTRGEKGPGSELKSAIRA
jgi:hypothetical protein